MLATRKPLMIYIKKNDMLTLSSIKSYTEAGCIKEFVKYNTALA